MRAEECHRADTTRLPGPRNSLAPFAQISGSNSKCRSPDRLPPRSPAMSLADVRFFINQAQLYDMPTRFLEQLVNHYKWDFETGPGENHVNVCWRTHKIVLSESTCTALRRADMAGISSVLTLYHECTHASSDWLDYDDAREFGEAMKHYEYAKRKNGD